MSNSPERIVTGIEFHAGSLGHLLTVAAGVTLDCKLGQQGNGWWSSPATAS